MRSIPLKLPEIGLHRGVPHDEYRLWNAISQSQLKLLLRNPKHGRYQWLNKAATTQEMKLGSAVHALILEPKSFNEQYYVSRKFSKYSKKGAALWKKMIAKFGEERILWREEFEVCCHIRNAILEHPRAAALINGASERELSGVWKDEETGLLCKLRLDLLHEAAAAIIDIKTTSDASEWAFSREIFKRGYHIQGGGYLEGMAALGSAQDSFAIIAAETEPPYCVAVYDLSSRDLELGRGLWHALLKLQAKCQSEGSYPGYSADIVTIELPEWARKQLTLVQEQI